MMELFKNTIAGGVEALGVSLNDRQMDAFCICYQMLSEKNKVMNLTALTEEKDVAEKHFLDSLSILPLVHKETDLRIADVGTGAGFPGLVLAVMLPGSKVTMFDAVGKKLSFVDEVIERLGLKNAVTVHGRAEDLGRDKKYREQFDLVTARALAGLPVLLEYCTPLAKPSGRFIAFKSIDLDEELKTSQNAAEILRVENSEPVRFSLPGTDISRAFVVYTKNGKTPAGYPRRAGIPSKESL